MSAGKLLTKLKGLEEETLKHYYSLIKKVKEKNGSDVCIIKDYEDHYIQIIDQKRGCTIDVHPVLVTSEGITVEHADGSEFREDIHVLGIANTYDRIILCSFLEEML
jgi:hypothetical protein